MIERAGSGGIPLISGAFDPAALRADADALGRGEDEIRRLYSAARRLGLVYARSGHLVAKKSAIAAAASPTGFWSALAVAVSSARSADPAARDLLLLAIADGSLADPQVGIGAAARAFAVMSGWRRNAWHPWDYDERHNPDCDQRCECPNVAGTTWHDVVAQTIRDAAASAAGEGGFTVAARGGHGDALDAGIAPEWIEGAFGRSSVIDSRSRVRSVSKDPQDVVSEMLRAGADVIELLTLFGLSRADDGAWIVPAPLREFAKAALR